MEDPRDNGIQWMMNAIDKRSERYIEAEKFVIELAEMSWWKRAFALSKIMKFLKSRDKCTFDKL